MGRLTIPDVRVDEHTTRRSVIDVAAVREHAMEFYCRLKAYEDTGIEPEAVETVKLALAAKHLVALETLNNTPISRLVELAEADKDGRCVVLPCKVGDTVYTNNRVLGADNAIHDEICTRRIKGYGGNALNKVWLIANGDYCDLSIFPSEFGKTVFLTREGAEKALEAMKDG
jgi:hypothetical protein|nr:MAG TPA: hypothetical protein [Caudoviricetes sp.]